MVNIARKLFGLEREVPEEVNTGISENRVKEVRTRIKLMKDKRQEEE